MSKLCWLTFYTINLSLSKNRWKWHLPPQLSYQQNFCFRSYLDSHEKIRYHTLSSDLPSLSTGLILTKIQIKWQVFKDIWPFCFVFSSNCRTKYFCRNSRVAVAQSSFFYRYFFHRIISLHMYLYRQTCWQWITCPYLEEITCSILEMQMVVTILAIKKNFDFIQ
jgi:hypothetical protein